MAPSFDYLLCAEDNDIIFEDDCDDLLCDHENNQNQIFVKNLETQRFPLQSDECLNLLIEKECEQFVGFFDYLNKLKNGHLDLVARQEAVEWITKVHAHFNFGPLCAYLAINYLDRFLAVYELLPVHAHFSFGPLCAYLAINYLDRFLAVYELPAKASMMQLLAVSCLSLAAKVEETEVPSILDFQVGGSRFLFKAKAIQEMELLVLTTLKWRMQSVTPFSFIDDFLVKVNGGQPISKALILTSTQLFLWLVKGVEFLEFRPSEIAAAVASFVMVSTQISPLGHFVQEERVLKCIDLLKEVNGDCTSSSRNGTLTSMPKSPFGVLEAACFSNKTDESTVESCLNSANKRKKYML